MLKTILFTALFSLLPVSELRGGLPYAFFNDLGIIPAYLLATAFNILVFPLADIFVNTLHKVLYRYIKLYRRFFDGFLKRCREKVSTHFNKYGYVGLMLFVGIPLPITGAWTAAIGSRILNLDKKKSFLYISLGVLLSGIIVSAVILTGSGLSNLVVKQI